MSDKLNIKNEMHQLEIKNRGFYDELTDEEKKKFSNFLMIRWGSAVTGKRDYQEYYILSTNQTLNKNFFDINRHPKLQWLLATCISPGLEEQSHEWIAFKGKASKNKRANLLGKLYPDMKMSDLETMAATMGDDGIKSLLVNLGWDAKKIKEAMK